MQSVGGTDLERTTKRLTLESDIAAWADQQAKQLNMSFSMFVSTLLEWARDEDFANDSMLFQSTPHLQHPRLLNLAEREVVENYSPAETEKPSEVRISA